MTIGIVFFTALFVSNVSAQTSAAAANTVADPGANIVSAAATTVTIRASNTTPAVKQSVTFTATLKSGSTPLSAKPVTIYHYYNGTRANDVTNKSTNANGQVTANASFASAGQRTYYATFHGDSSYGASTSSVLTINVR
ncbi:MAG: Ig-like domain-containing protein [Halobacteriota archaeon]